MQTNQKYSLGRGGSCICPRCGYKSSHKQGQPCQDSRCPDCGVKLLREGSYHHHLWEKKQQKNQ